MILSQGRQKLFARLIIDGLWGDEIIDFDEDDEERVIMETRRIIEAWVGEQGDIDQSVRQSLANLKRGVPEGSSEWNILYRKYYNQEMSRRGHK